MKKLRNIFAELMYEIGLKDKNIVVMVGDISHGILQPYAKKFPNRYYNVGICEPTIVNMASGLSHMGLNPIVHTIAPFLTERSYEQIKLDFGYQKRSINLVSVGGSFDYSQLGCSHHCYSDVAILDQLKDANIFLPTNENEFRSLFLKNYKKKQINYFRLSEFSNIYEKNKKIISGKANTLKSGKDITIVFIGPYYEIIKKALTSLSNIDAEIIHIHTFSPFDSEIIKKSVKKTRKLLTIEELYYKGGLKSKCIESITKLNENIKIDYIAVKDFIRSYGDHKELSQDAGLTYKNIIKKIKKIIERK